MTYGYAGEGWKSGSYYTKYISNNEKFYKLDGFYGKKIYTPFWNVVKEQYQASDCGVDCDYLGPRNLMAGMIFYVAGAAILLSFFAAIVCGKEKIDLTRG